MTRAHILSERPLRVGPISFGALVVYGDLGPLLVDILAALATVAVEPHQRFATGTTSFGVQAASESEPTKQVKQPGTDGMNGGRDQDWNPGKAIRYGKIELNPAKHRVMKGGQEIHLTPKEFALLHHLMQCAGEPVPYERLLKAVWGPQYGSEHEYLRTYVRQLRIKIEDDPANPRYLKVVTSLGYVFEDRHSLP